MAFRYEFRPSAARDLFKLTRRDHALLHAIVTEHIPAILRDPHRAGDPKKGALAGLRAYELTARRIAYRLVYEIDGDAVLFVAIGPHDQAYARAERR